ncbi:hypothetical protein CLOM_g17760 [Closterium sp. NIES-68]|nr:hypothetical protein CLOM_g17760 [Closterium sp. NIES-68]GJP62055.1 hypothetical protein CLOP_g19156 [Closterium sp. NIES-67]
MPPTTSSQPEAQLEDPYAQLALDRLAHASSSGADVAAPQGVASRPTGRRTLCERCQRPSRACLCPSLPPSRLKTRTRVIVLQHPHEAKKRLATAPILALTLDSTRIITGRRFLAGSYAELDQALIPRCRDRSGASWQGGSGSRDTEAGRGEEENGHCRGEGREGGDGVEAGEGRDIEDVVGRRVERRERQWREGHGDEGGARAEVGSEGEEKKERASTSASVQCKERSRDAWDGMRASAEAAQMRGAGDGICVCGHVRLLLFPGEGAEPVGDWWRWYLHQRQLELQHPGQHEVEQHPVRFQQRVRVQQHGCAAETACGMAVQTCGVGRGEKGRVCGEGYGVTLVVIDGTWEHAKEMMKASGSFLRRHCKMVCLPFDLASPGPPPGHLGLVMRKEPHKGAVSTVEAVARALDVLEGDLLEGVGTGEKGASRWLLSALHHMVSFQLQSTRGVKQR